jgi:porin
MRRFWMTSIGCAAMVGMACTTPALSAEPAQESAEETPAAVLDFTYTGDLWNVSSGGVDRDMVYLDNLDLQLSLDLERLVGWSGTQAFAYVLYNNGNSVSELSSDFNGISNIETGVEALRLYEAWIDHAFAEGKGSVRFGLYDLNSEFDAGEVRALFLNPGHGIGTDYAQSGANGPSIFPVASLAVRVNYQFEGDVYLRGTIADGVPGNPDHPKRTTIDLEEDDGLLLAAETGIARDGRLWSFGAWTYTEEAPDLVTADEHTNYGAYLALEERLLSADAGDSFDLSGSFRFGVANEDVNPMSTVVSATLVATGLIPAWPEDQIGLGFLLTNGSDKFLSTIGDPEDHEINIELTYFANLTENITIQPDIQWVINPGLDGSVEDVFVFGLRLSVNKRWSLD